jgi:hypothetical protein
LILYGSRDKNESFPKIRLGSSIGRLASIRIGALMGNFFQRVAVGPL